MVPLNGTYIMLAGPWTILYNAVTAKRVRDFNNILNYSTLYRDETTHGWRMFMLPCKKGIPFKVGTASLEIQVQFNHSSIFYSDHFCCTPYGLKNIFRDFEGT